MGGPTKCRSSTQIWIVQNQVVKKDHSFFRKEKKRMSILALEVKVSPADAEDLPKWREDLLWQPNPIRTIVKYIEDNMISKVKSGYVLIRDLEDNAFKTISFRGRNILQPKSADAICKLKRETKKGLTFDEKIELLERFVLEEGRVPEADDVYEDFRIGTFYKSLTRSKDKYDGLIDKFKSSGSNGSDPEDASIGADGSSDDDGRGRVARRRGPVKESSKKSKKESNKEE